MTVLLGPLEQLPCWQLAPSAQPAHFLMCKVKWQACMQLLLTCWLLPPWVTTTPLHSLEMELPERLHKGTALNVTNSATQLNDTHIRHTRHAIHWYVSNALNPVLNGICDVRHNLQHSSNHNTAAELCPQVVHQFASVGWLDRPYPDAYILHGWGLLPWVCHVTGCRARPLPVHAEERVGNKEVV